MQYGMSVQNNLKLKFREIPVVQKINFGYQIVICSDHATKRLDNNQ